VVFSDLRGFSASSENSEPEEVMGVLREFHTAIGEIIHRYEGTLERFAGDGMACLRRWVGGTVAEAQTSMGL
jgi:adenylate cyclase